MICPASKDTSGYQWRSGGSFHYIGGIDSGIHGCEVFMGSRRGRHQI